MNRSGLSSIEKELVRRAEETFGAKGDPRLVLGVSGGPDSMALMHAFHRTGMEAVPVHLNYGLRGEESDADAALVKEQAEKWGFAPRILQADPGGAEEENTQQWARRKRYEAFRAAAREKSADGIALAHHEDDQAETILQKIFRGGGMESWQGMQVWDGELFRPLLGVSRREIEEYVRQHDIPHRTDRSNLESKYARNFLRNEWLPEMTSRFPGWKRNVLRVAREAGTFESALEWIHGRLADERGRLDRGELLALEPSLLKALVLHLARKVEPGASVSGSALDELEKLQTLQTGKAIRLTENLEVLRDRGHFKLVVESGERPVSVPLPRERLADRPFRFNGLRFAVESCGEPEFGEKLYLDADAFGWPLTLRRWEEGDRFRPLGMEGRQNVSDHLTNRKVDASARSEALLLTSFEETVLAVIFPPIENRRPPGTVSEEAKCTEATDTCLVVSPAEEGGGRPNRPG